MAAVGAAAAGETPAAPGPALAGCVVIIKLLNCLRYSEVSTFAISLIALYTLLIRSASCMQSSPVSFASSCESMSSSASVLPTPASCLNSCERPTLRTIFRTASGISNTALFIPINPTPWLNLWSSKRFVDSSSRANAISRPLRLA